MIDAITRKTLARLILASVEDNQRVKDQGRCTQGEYLAAREFAQELTSNIAEAMKVDQEEFQSECGI